MLKGRLRTMRQEHDIEEVCLQYIFQSIQGKSKTIPLDMVTNVRRVCKADRQNKRCTNLTN